MTEKELMKISTQFMLDALPLADDEAARDRLFREAVAPLSPGDANRIATHVMGYLFDVVDALRARVPGAGVAIDDVLPGIQRRLDADEIR